MKKTLIAMLLVVVLTFSTLAVLVGCTPKTKGNFEIPEEGFLTDEPVTISFYSSMGQAYGAILDDYLEQFAQLYPKVTVEHQRIGDYDSVRNEIKTCIVSGQTPNLAFCYSDHVALYNNSKVVVTLDDLIDSDIEVTRADGSTEILGLTKAQKNDFISTYYEEGRAFGNGLMYMLPFAKSTELMFYNKEFFDANGLSVPDHWFAADGKIGTASSDKSSMEYVLYKIKELDPKSTPLGYDTGANWLITLFEQFETGYTKVNGDHYIFDNEDNHQILATLRRWYQARLFTTKSMSNGTYTSNFFVKPASSDNDTKSYISIGSSAGAAKQVPTVDPFEVGVTIVPQKNANTAIKDSKVISQGPSICLFKSDNPQEVLASWLLLKFLVTNAEFQARYGAEAGYLPVINSVMDLKAYKDKIENANTSDKMSGMAAKLCREYKDALFVSPAFYGSSKARDQMEELLDQCILVKGDNDAAIMQGIRAAFALALNECEEGEDD